MTRATQHWPPLAEAINLYESGWSLRQIAARVRSNPVTVGEWLRHVGIALRSRGGPNHKGKRVEHVLQ